MGCMTCIGNVWEWCWDWSGPYDMTKFVAQDPHGPPLRKSVREFLAGDSKSGKSGEKGNEGNWTRTKSAARSGAAIARWVSFTGYCGAWDRNSHPPDQPDTRIGFRVVSFPKTSSEGKEGK